MNKIILKPEIIKLLLDSSYEMCNSIIKDSLDRDNEVTLIKVITIGALESVVMLVDEWDSNVNESLSLEHVITEHKYREPLILMTTNSPYVVHDVINNDVLITLKRIVNYLADSIDDETAIRNTRLFGSIHTSDVVDMFSKLILRYKNLKKI